MEFSHVIKIIAIFILTPAKQTIDPVKKGKFFVPKVWNTIEHVGKNQGKTRDRAQPLTPIFRINIQQEGFTVNESSAHTIKKWSL